MLESLTEYDPATATIQSAYNILQARGLIGKIFDITGLNVFMSTGPTLIADQKANLPHRASYYQIPYTTTTQNIGSINRQKSLAVQIDIFDASHQPMQPDQGYDAAFFISIPEALNATQITDLLPY